MLAGSDKQRKRKGVRGTSMKNQNSINQAERRGCKIGMLYVCVTTSSVLDVQDGVQCWRKCSNNPRKLIKGRKVINDAEMFVLKLLTTEER